MGKGVTDDNLFVLLEGTYMGDENEEDVIFYLNKHLMENHNISLYDMLDENEAESKAKVAAAFGNNHTRLWPWNKAAMSFKLR